MKLTLKTSQAWSILTALEYAIDWENLPIHHPNNEIYIRIVRKIIKEMPEEERKFAEERWKGVI